MWTFLKTLHWQQFHSHSHHLKLSFLMLLQAGFSSPSSPEFALLFCAWRQWHCHPLWLEPLVSSSFFSSITAPPRKTLPAWPWPLCTQTSLPFYVSKAVGDQKTHPASTISHPGSGLQSHVPLLPVAIISEISGWILVFFLNLMLPHLLENFKQLSSPCRIKSKPSRQNLPIAEINTFTTFPRTFLVLLRHFPSLCPSPQKLFPASLTLVTTFLLMKCSSQQQVQIPPLSGIFLNSCAESIVPSSTNPRMLNYTLTTRITLTVLWLYLFTL